MHINAIKLGAVAAQYPDAGINIMRKVWSRLAKKTKDVFEGVLEKGEKTHTVPTVRGAPEILIRGQVQKTVVSNKRNLIPSKWIHKFVNRPKVTLPVEFQKLTGRFIQPAYLFGRHVWAGGKRVPLFAFVGMCMATGSKMEIGRDQMDDVCKHISTLMQSKPVIEPEKSMEIGEQLCDYDFGPLIAKGCNAAVYPARLKEAQVEETTEVQKSAPPCIPLVEEETSDSDIEAEEDFVHVTIDDDLRSDITILSQTESDITILSEDSAANCTNKQNQSEPCDELDLAIKMMFNFDATSAAWDIMRTMQSEALPARHVNTASDESVWEMGNHTKKKRLKPHPNIVEMHGLFVDEVPQFPESLEEYPAALPTRLNPEGFGRNRTMFLVMKRYPFTLREYLDNYKPSLRESVLLLCQLTEAVLHLNQNNIAHRDMKSDNVLINITNNHLPHLVLSDFGCSLQDDEFSLMVPFPTGDVCRGGNISHMAPEIKLATPGRDKILDYRKADVWSAGCLAEEIFGGHVPEFLQSIIGKMRRDNPTERPDALLVANMLQILLWAPAKWLSSLDQRSSPPCKVRVMRWLLTLTAEVMCTQSCHQDVERDIKYLFLARLNFEEVMRAVEYLWEL